MRINKKIIHFDLDAFYCAVEELFDPALKERAFAVGGRPDQRGVVASCSYAARQFGVRSAMPMSRALRLCPELIIVPWRRKAYGEKSKEVMAILHVVTPLVEQLSIDEAFLDVSENDMPGQEIAKQIQTQVKNQTHLPCSLGVATNKLVAKVASDVGKAMVKTNSYPNAIQVVEPGDEAAFLAPLPIDALWGVGPKTAEKLRTIGVFTIGQIADWPENDLVNRFGQMGFEMAQRARGIDTRPVVIEREAKSYSQEITFSEDVLDETKLRETIQRQSEEISKSLKRANLQGSTIKLKLRWPDFTTLTRQTTLEIPTAEAEAINQTAWDIFNKHWKRSIPVRLLGVGVSGLQLPNKQLSLWDTVDIKKQSALDEALNEIRSKFGDEAIHKGSET